MQSRNDTHCYTISNKSEHTIGQIWALKGNNIFLWNSEGAFETAQCHVIFLPVEAMQIHRSVSKIKIEIQKKIWTSRYGKRVLNVAFVSDFIWPFLRPYMGVIPIPKMAFIFPISWILALIFPIFIKYFPKYEGKGTFPKFQIKSLFVHTCASTAWADPGIFVKLDNVFSGFF